MKKVETIEYLQFYNFEHDPEVTAIEGKQLLRKWIKEIIKPSVI